MKNIQSCLKNIMPSLLLAVAIPFIEATLILFPILSPPGFVFYGDVSPILEPYNTLISSYSMLNFQSAMGPSSAFIWIPFFFTLYIYFNICRCSNNVESVGYNYVFFTSDIDVCVCK
jgi:hypothetical protein